MSRFASRHRSRPLRDDLITDDGAPSPLPTRLLHALIVALPLVLGGVHPEVRLAALALSLLALALKLRRLRAEGRALTLGPWGAAGLLAAGVALLQLAPLPAGLVGVLSPERLAVGNAIAEALGDPPPGWLTLGLDAGRVALGASGLLLFLAVYLVARHGRAGELVRVRLVLALELAACAVVGVGVLHAALGWEGLLGFHGGPSAGGPFPATFMNPNHLASLCLMAALTAFGAAIHDKLRAGWHAGAAAVASFGVLASLSRANALLLVAGLGLVALPHLGIRWPFSRTKEMGDEPPERVVRARRLTIGLGALVFMALILAGPERWAVELGTLLADPADGASAAGPAAPLGGRLGLVAGCWGVAWGVVQAFPWTGAGLGNLALATPAFTEDWTSGRITHAHHAFLEVAGELGLLVAVAVAALVALGLFRAWRASEGDPLLWGGLVALGAVLVQNFVDFSLWIPGVAVPAAALAGLVSRGHDGLPSTPAVTRSGWLRGPLVLALGVLAGLGGALLGPPSGLSAASPAALLTPAAPAPADWRALAARHGADFSVLEVAGAMAEAGGELDAARRLARAAVTRNPHGPGPLGRAFKFAILDGDDAVAADILERLHAQGEAGRAAALDLALVAGRRPVVQTRFFGFDPRRVLRAADILRFRGEGEAARALVSWAIGALGHHLPLVEAWAGTLAPTAAEAETLSQLGSFCLAEAVKRAASRPEGAPPDPVAEAWERLGLLVEGEHQRALGLPLAAWSRYMAAAAVGIPESAAAPAMEAALPDDSARATRSRALFRAAEVALAAGRLDRLDEALAQLDHATLTAPYSRAARHILRSERFAARGQTREAIREVQQAVRLQPQVPEHHARLAPLFTEVGDPEAAARALARAEALRGAEGTGAARPDDPAAGQRSRPAAAPR